MFSERGGISEGESPTLLGNKTKNLNIYEKNFLMMAAMCAAILAMAEFKTEFNTDEATAINITEAGEYRVFSATSSATNVPIVVAKDIADTVFITLENINITPESDASAMLVGANSVVVLNLTGMESALTGKNGCGIETEGGLVINGTKDNKLTCTGAGRSAGIGTTQKNAAAGDIVINGGNIVAKSGHECAGIGASNAGRIGNITINGGYIEAAGNAYSAGIGGSYCSKNNNGGKDTVVIAIKGGVVDAQAGYYNDNRAIGKSKTHGGNIAVVISGGSIITRGETGEKNGIVFNPTNGTESVSAVTYVLPDALLTLVTEGHIGDLQLGSDYGIKDVYTTAEGRLFFYLPESAKTAEAEINGVKMEAEAAGETPDPQAIENTNGDMTAIEVLRTDNGIIINHTENNMVSIMDMTGKTVMEGVVSDNQPIALSNGLYVVRVNHIGSFKYVVR